MLQRPNRHLASPVLSVRGEREITLIKLRLVVEPARHLKIERINVNKLK